MEVVVVGKIAKSALLVLALALILSESVQAQFGNNAGQDLDKPRFTVDVAAFRAPEKNQVHLEIYYLVYNDGLRFFKKKDEFVANYELNVVILGEDNKQLTGTSVERLYRLNNYRSTRNPADFLINMLSINIGAGKYKLVAKLIDKNSNKIGSIEKEFEVKSLFKGVNDISEIEFVREVIDKDTSTSRFDKGEKRIIPSVIRQYGEDIGQISMYFELYHDAAEDQEGRLLYEIYGDKNKKVYDDDFELLLDRPITRFVKHIPLDDFLPGNYRIKITLAERNGKVIAFSESEFSVAWSLRALVRNDFELALEQLKFVASRQEQDHLKEVPPQERERAFAEFWASHDPTPETPENELMEKYYGRIKYANREFSSINLEGWRTDRGMIYIIFGEPDHVENHPFELDSKPYQVWYYYSLSRTFGFVDENGTGDYRLQFPYDGRDGFLDDKIDDYD